MQTKKLFEVRVEILKKIKMNLMEQHGTLSKGAIESRMNDNYSRHFLVFECICDYVLVFLVVKWEG